MSRSIFLGGAHRGGRAITENALRTLRGAGIYDHVIIADPKEDRARQLARTWQDSGIGSTGLKKPCEKAVKETSADAVVLAIDTISPMSTVLEENPLPTQWQLMAKGLGTNGPVIGLSGTVMDGDMESRSKSIRLIRELATFIQPQSSSGIRENPLNADSLHIMRNRVSGHSVKRLPALERDPDDISGGPLSFFWGTSVYPLLVQEKPASNRWRDTKKQVVETELPVSLQSSPAFAVACVGQKEVDFFIVESAGVRRTVRFHLPFVHSLPDANSPSSGPAMVTD